MSKIMSKYIIDTNVWVAASGKATCTPECMEACLQLLQTFKEVGAALVLDRASFEEEPPPGNSVLTEFKNNIKEGDYAHSLFWNDIFNSWSFDIHDIQYNTEGALLPSGIIINQEENGSIYPFEPSDRKWIALHLSIPERPPIHNATDGDWEKARNDLTRNGINVRQLCCGRNIP